MSAKLMSTPIYVPNRLGWVTSLTVEHKRDYIDVTSFGDRAQMVIPNLRTVEADLHIVANDPGTLMELFQTWMNDGISKPILQKEYMCLYCATPNLIDFPSCKKCGAPRSFVIG